MEEANMKGVKVVNNDGIHIFRIDNYPTEDDFNKDWTSLTRRFELENKWFTVDPIYY